ncbi:hypothetical protein RDWZM_005593 [Blomia tropicalis]|uniref:Protein giant-lens n=1 Tax=Blomia tropicalis TaxID=40697 RepID=A0A9Q0M5I5_BLOTA|nr:hypothetical protein RDWZM_005593 [Blomia tropicalis]
MLVDNSINSTPSSVTVNRSEMFLEYIRRQSTEPLDDDHMTRVCDRTRRIRRKSENSNQMNRPMRIHRKQNMCSSRILKSPLRSNVRWFVIAICCTVFCLVGGSTQHQSDFGTSTIANNKHILIRQLRHRVHGTHRHHQHRRHQYYQSNEPQSHHSAKNEETSSSISTTTIASNIGSVEPIYFMQQLIRQQRSRHPYYYYYHYDHHDESNANTNFVHNRSSYRRHWPSTRQANGRHLHERVPKVIYQLNGIESDDQLPLCDAFQVCNKVDTYSTPWIEKQCRCPIDSKPCSHTTSTEDGHTVAEKTRQYKICEPVRKLPTCRYFRDITWTITTTSAKSEQSLNSLLASAAAGSAQMSRQHETENITRQEMKCVCPPNSVAYIFKHQVYKSDDGQLGYRYHFACSPETKLRCKRKEPCRLFTAKKRPRVEEVTTNTLCQCPASYSCPVNHRHPSVLIGTAYLLDNIRTYSGYCYPDHTINMNGHNNNNNKDDIGRSSSTEKIETLSINNKNRYYIFE